MSKFRIGDEVVWEGKRLTISGFVLDNFCVGKDRHGGEWTIPCDETTAEDESKFEVGDRVRITSSAHSYEGETGTIVDKTGGNLPYRVKTVNSRYAWYDAEYLELAHEDVINMYNNTAEDGKVKPLVQNIPSDVLLQVGEVMAFGAKKYSQTKWLDEPTTPKKRLGSALRHIYHHLAGEKHDPESGLLHLNHAITQLLMAAHYINIGVEDE